MALVSFLLQWHTNTPIDPLSPIGWPRLRNPAPPSALRRAVSVSIGQESRYVAIGPISIRPHARYGRNSLCARYLWNAKVGEIGIRNRDAKCPKQRRPPAARGTELDIVVAAELICNIRTPHIMFAVINATGPFCKSSAKDFLAFPELALAGPTRFPHPRPP